MWKRVTSLTSVAILISTLSATAQLRPGDEAPTFALPAASKDSILSTPVTLSSLHNSGPAIVAFYPADWSGGCTKEMCTFRDNFSRLGSLGVTVAGISGDYVNSHREWAHALNLPFLLLSDHDHAVARAYQSITAGSTHDMRTVFLVSKTGHIAYADYAFKAGSDESFEALHRAVQALRAKEGL
jgi:peroxiredoxin